MDISLVVCTRNRAEQLVPALESLAALSYDGPWELVIVDNGSVDATPALLRSFEQSFKGQIRVIQEPKPGLARARNAGWRVASGRWIAFTDDDCYPRSDLLQQIAGISTQEDLGFVGGRVLLHDPEDLPVTIQTLKEPRSIPPCSFIPVGFIHGANFAFRRAVLERIAGFDERLGAGTNFFAAEDTDALARASAAGWRGAYEPNCVVAHHHRRRSAAALKNLQRGYDIAVGAYYIKCVLNPRLCLKYIMRWPGVIKGVARSGGLFWHFRGVMQFLMTTTRMRRV